MEMLSKGPFAPSDFKCKQNTSQKNFQIVWPLPFMSTNHIRNPETKLTRDQKDLPLNQNN